MTGFRLAKGGAQERLGVTPDLTTLGKIIGGGMPVGAYGGKKEIMDFVSPSGPVYQAGTLSGNPIAMTAGLSMLHFLNTHPHVYEDLDKMGNFIVEGIKDSLRRLGLPYTVNQIGSMYTLFFTSSKVENFTHAKMCDTAKFGRYFQAMLKRGIYLAPSQFESLFISTAISHELADKIIRSNEEALREIL
jgi:glutamate-1-semialdehyde 2,1-aminomutase